MKQKLTFLILALFTAMGAWATVTMPTLTTDETNPTYYVIQSFRSGKYANYVGTSAQLTQVESASATVNTLWYFVANSDGVSIVPAADPTVKLASTSSATVDGAVWYIPENPYKAGVFCVSLTSDATANCWDDQGGHTTIGYWQPAANDNEGTSWRIVEVPVTKSEVDAGTADMTFALTKLDILARLAPLSSLSVYTDANVAAVRNAADETALNTALQAFETNISLYCRSGKYLVAGASACEYVTTPSEYNHVIQLKSAGNGCFYLKGYKSEKYIGQVRMSTAVSTTSTPDESFYFENSNGYVVVKNVSGGGYAYIHNGGSGCVGWEPSAANTQHTIAEVELPAAFVNVTYHLMVGGVDKAQSTVKCGVGDASDASALFVYPYTTFTYDVATITAGTTDVYATANFNMPFTVSTDYASATWYYVQGHASYNNYYISTNGTGIGCASGFSRADAYKWAFIGNPVDGIKVINKASGDGYYINETDPATMGTTAKAWTLKQQTTTSWHSGTRGFGLYDSSLEYLNCRPGTPGSIKYWSGFDQGSTFWVGETDAITSDKNALGDAIAAAQALVDGAGVPGYINSSAASTLSSAISTAQSVYNDASGDYASAYNTLAAAIATASVPANINYTPRTDVYYTIVNARGAMVYDPSHDASVDTENDNAKYIWYGSTTPDATDVNNLWGFIEQDGNYYMYNVGKQQFATVGHGTYGSTWIFSDTPAYITLDDGIADEIAAPGVRVRATIVTTGLSYTMSVSTSYTGPVITYDYNGDGGVPMRFAESPVAVDASITAIMTAKVEDVTPYRNALKDVIDACTLIPIGDGLNQYASNSTYTTALADANTAYNNASATKSELQTATVNLEAAIAGLVLNLPAAGFYRIQGATSGKYLAAGLAANNKFNMTDATDATTIFYYNGTILVNYGSGKSNGVNTSAWAWVNEDDASTVVFKDGLTNGGYAIQTAAAHFYDNGDGTNSADRGGDISDMSGANVRYRSWQLTPVTTLPVTVTAAGYATLYSPVALTIPSDVKAYYVSALTSTEATLTEINTTIPAETPVILKADEGSYNFVTTTGGTDVSASNKLSGTLGGVAVADDEAYTLQRNVADTETGLFPKAAGDIVGFKAYLLASAFSSPVKGFNFVFDDDATGLERVQDVQEVQGAIYNLAGQRLNKIQKGINIVNGKKILK